MSDDLAIPSDEPDQDNWYLTPTHLLEYLYCQRFTYYEHVLRIPQHQEERTKVVKGRDVHEQRQRINTRYLRKKLGVVKREIDVELDCTHLHLRGKVDELYWLNDDTMSPFDYKFSENKGKIFFNQKVQAALYAIMIRELYDRDVTRAFICYTRSKYQIETIDMTETLLEQANEHLHTCIDIIRTGYYPPPTAWSSRCEDCCYKNICIK